MEKSGENSRPLTSTELSHLQTLKAVGKPKADVILNLSTFRLPKGAKASLVKVEDRADVYRVQTTFDLGQIGHRPPFDKIPAEPVNIEKLEQGKIRAVPEGLRPTYLPVKFLPKRIKLELSQRAKPSFDFDYKRELVDRPTNVFAPDDRYIYRDTSFPWCTVGRVDTPLGQGTGYTIGSRLLVTANHAIQWNSDGTAGWVRFRPAYYNGDTPFGEAWATRVIYWTPVTGGDGLSDRETAYDYVVCVLDTRIGDIVGYPGYRTYNDDWNGDSYWQHMGYPTDLSGCERPAFQGGCVISSVKTESVSGAPKGYVLGHFNDVVVGHSGGPVWGWWSAEPWPRVVGGQSAEASVPSNDTSGDNEFGGGRALSDLISWARSHYS